MKALSLRSILIPFIWDKMVGLDNFVAFSIFNFVIGHNRKIPSGIKETHEVDLYLSGL